jgi:hypothetical protein
MLQEIRSPQMATNQFKEGQIAALDKRNRSLWATKVCRLGLEGFCWFFPSASLQGISDSPLTSPMGDQMLFL